MIISNPRNILRCLKALQNNYVIYNRELRRNRNDLMIKQVIQSKSYYSHREKERQLSFQSSFSFNTQKSNEQIPPWLIQITKMKDEIQKDLNSHCKSYSQIKDSLVYHVQKENYNKRNQNQLIEVLYLFSHYPLFSLSNQVILLIYKIVCFNMHMKSVEDMNKLLLFVLVADQQASQSPIFHEFIRFYLHHTLEQFKFKYQLDFSNMSVYQAIKQFLGKLVHRGFLSRSPPYERNLNILQYSRTLNLLRKSPTVKDTLMVKKINYTLFMQIKQFYEEQMHENLYHEKKIELLKKFNKNYLQILSQQIEMTHYQAVHLRQLYMKLYLTIVERSGEEEAEYPPLHTELEAFRYKNVIYLYQLAINHIERMDHLRLQQISEKIDVVIEFVQRVKYNMINLLQFSEPQLTSLQLEFEEILLILILVKKADEPSKKCLKLVQLLNQKMSAVAFSSHFDLLIEVVPYFTVTSEIGGIVCNYDYFELLTLGQLPNLLRSFQVQQMDQIALQNYQTVVSHVLKKVLSTDFQVIGGKQVVCFLQIYQAYLKLPQSADFEGQRNQFSFANAEGLRIFVMRYISDHHKQFSVKEFQTIVKMLLSMPLNSCQKFDDDNQSYPLSIFDEIKPYLRKVSILFSSETTKQLQISDRIIFDS